MLLKSLPPIDFVAADRSVTRLVLADQGAAIARRAAYLRAHCAPGDVIGLALRSEPALVLGWLAAIAAGLRPLILQYPTAKQTREYWRGSVANTIELTGCRAILGDARVAALLDGINVAVLDPEGEAAADTPVDALPAFTILQLSSGTTGHRKAVAFTEDQLARHVEDYNAVLALDPAADRIASWLPLYHDMGFIACFVMPLLLGVPVTMVDPEVWVADRAMLFDVIESSRATLCYMPNFGFEVLATPTPRDLSSMRLWISCSEPVIAATARRFLAAHDLPADRFAACYAMAENVFAVTLGRGIAEREIDGASVVSCGAPIPNVDLKIVDGEIYARSRASIEAYLGGDDIRDADGFYPTGDVGALIDGALYVAGRRRDVLIQAGRKFVLSNIDAAVNALLPEVKGRVAAVALRDDRLGTEKPAVLVEAADFFDRTDHQEVAAAVQARTGLDFLEVHFVPPRFLTKTSSGKINRVVSARDWLARDAATAITTTTLEEFDRTFGRMRADAPVGALLDSLSQTLLRIVLADAGVAFDADATLADYRARIAETQDAPASDERPFRIVSLGDRRAMKQLDEETLLKLSAKIGRPLSYQHLCLPPSPVLLSDLVFYDWFRIRLPDQAPLEAVGRAFARLREADVILMDDTAEIYFPLTQVYPALSHRLERAPDADLIAVRWQRYAQHHHELPVVPVDGSTLPIRERPKTLAALSRYLGKPLFRIATIKSFDEHTADWELRPLVFESGGPGIRPLQRALLLRGLIKPLRAIADEAGIPRGEPRVAHFDTSDLSHFCAHPIDRGKLDTLVDSFDSFCVVGQPASLVYLRDRIAERGKRYVTAPSYDPRVLEAVGDFDCLIACGPTGKLHVDTPAAAIMGAGWATASIDLPVPQMTYRGTLANAAPQDWYHVAETGDALTAEELGAVKNARHRASARRDITRSNSELSAAEVDAYVEAYDPRAKRQAMRREMRRKGLIP